MSRKDPTFELGSVIGSAVLTLILLYLSYGQMLARPVPVPELLDMEKNPMTLSLMEFFLAGTVFVIGLEIFRNGFSALSARHFTADTVTALCCGALFLYSAVISGLVVRGRSSIAYAVYGIACVVLTAVMLGKYLKSRSNHANK